MQESYCYYCGGVLSREALPFIHVADAKEATPRPGQPCRCSKLDVGSVDERPTEAYRMTDDDRSAGHRI